MLPKAKPHTSISGGGGGDSDNINSIASGNPSNSYIGISASGNSGVLLATVAIVAVVASALAVLLIVLELPTAWWCHYSLLLVIIYFFHGKIDLSPTDPNKND